MSGNLKSPLASPRPSTSTTNTVCMNNDMTTTTPNPNIPILHLPPSLRIISLNCWGLKFISTHRSARLLEIGRQLSLASPTPTLVGLQECWTQADYLAIRSLTKSILPYGKFYFSGIFGSGLAILSKYPIEESSMYRYPLNGRPSAFYRGDCPAGQRWEVEDAEVGMTMRHPTLRCSLSDHFSVETTLVRRTAGEAESERAMSTHLPIETYDEILDMIAKYDVRERKQRRLRLTHFVVEVFIALGCFVAVWWSPHNFVAFLLMLLSTLGLSAGVLDGLMGGLFVGSELRALKEFEYEVRNAREQALRCSGSNP
ncbi:phospholipase C type enzyme [Friedmanniomyces endolithicus]|nr:phospholipase C type enzyme [Friedmanniomyces endolithicus]